jgi:hypothetical protein
MGSATTALGNVFLRNIDVWPAEKFTKKQTVGDAVEPYGALLENYPSATEEDAHAALLGSCCTSDCANLPAK